MTPILTFRTKPDGSEDALVGAVYLGSIVPTGKNERVRWRLNLGEGAVSAADCSRTDAAREVILLLVSDWYALQGIVPMGQVIEMQVERVER